MIPSIQRSKVGKIKRYKNSYIGGETIKNRKEQLTENSGLLFLGRKK